MDIVLLDFEKSLVIEVEGKQVKLTVFKMMEHGNVKFGIDAPRGLSVNRQEIYLQKQEKKQLSEG